MSEVLRVGRLEVPLSELTWRFDTPGGPGGQHANRAATRAEVRFAVAESSSLTDSQRRRLQAELGPVVVAAAADSRSQSRNKDLALERLRTLLGEAMRKVPPAQDQAQPGRQGPPRRQQEEAQRGQTHPRPRQPHD